MQRRRRIDSRIACTCVAEVNIKGGISGVHMTLSREGRPSGEAYIELESEQDVEVGLQRHNEHIGHRYIEGESDLHTSLARLGPGRVLLSAHTWRLTGTSGRDRTASFCLSRIAMGSAWNLNPVRFGDSLVYV